MAEATENAVSSTGRSGAGVKGDVPEVMRKRYFVDGRGGQGVGFYTDAQVKTPAFRDHGRKLVTARNDPNSVRDMVEIARHREWAIVAVSGTKTFRREAWIMSRAAGLEVRGYQPTERDVQALDRQLQRQRGGPDGSGPTPAKRQTQRADPAAREALQFIETVLSAWIRDPQRRAAILKRAEGRVGDALDRGDRIVMAGRGHRPDSRERSRSR
ncbi:MAG: hypothetical protein J0I28_01465 [Caulobacterales bacterium]|nr:hypothetical protein [Caulobacterales bacterium]